MMTNRYWRSNSHKTKNIKRCFEWDEMAFFKMYSVVFTSLPLVTCCCGVSVGQPCRLVTETAGARAD